MAYRSGLCFPNCPGDAIKAGLKWITADAFFCQVAAPSRVVVTPVRLDHDSVLRRRSTTADSRPAITRPARTGRRAIQYLPHLLAPSLPTISRSGFPRLELSGNGIEACVAGRLDVPNYRQDVGRKIASAGLWLVRRNSTYAAR
jgi:hypothetical protein